MPKVSAKTFLKQAKTAIDAEVNSFNSNIQ